MPRKKATVTDRALTVPPDLMSDPRIKARLENPYGEPSAPIQLKNPTMRPRWFNADIMTDKIWRAKAKGWNGVRPEDVTDLDQVGHYVVSAEGFIARGERGKEILMAMPKDAYDAIERAKAAYNIRNMGSMSKTKNEVIEAAGQKFGDEAATFLSKSHVNIQDSYERVQRSDGELE
jgi:hypothetical protein